MFFQRRSLDSERTALALDLSPGDSSDEPDRAPFSSPTEYRRRVSIVMSKQRRMSRMRAELDPSSMTMTRTTTTASHDQCHPSAAAATTTTTMTAAVNDGACDALEHVNLSSGLVSPPRDRQGWVFSAVHRLTPRLLEAALENDDDDRFAHSMRHDISGNQSEDDDDDGMIVVRSAAMEHGKVIDEPNGECVVPLTELGNSGGEHDDSDSDGSDGSQHQQSLPRFAPLMMAAGDADLDGGTSMLSVPNRVVDIRAPKPESSGDDSSRRLLAIEHSQQMIAIEHGQQMILTTETLDVDKKHRPVTPPMTSDEEEQQQQHTQSRQSDSNVTATDVDIKQQKQPHKPVSSFKQFLKTHMNKSAGSTSDSSSPRRPHNPSKNSTSFMVLLDGPASSLQQQQQPPTSPPHDVSNAYPTPPMTSPTRTQRLYDVRMWQKRVSGADDVVVVDDSRLKQQQQQQPQHEHQDDAIRQQHLMQQRQLDVLSWQQRQMQMQLDLNNVADDEDDENDNGGGDGVDDQDADASLLPTVSVIPPRLKKNERPSSFLSTVSTASTINVNLLPLYNSPPPPPPPTTTTTTPLANATDQVAEQVRQQQQLQGLIKQNEALQRKYEEQNAYLQQQRQRQQWWPVGLSSALHHHSSSPWDASTATPESMTAAISAFNEALSASGLPTLPDPVIATDDDADNGATNEEVLLPAQRTLQLLAHAFQAANVAATVTERDIEDLGACLARERSDSRVLRDRVSRLTRELEASRRDVECERLRADRAVERARGAEARVGGLETQIRGLKRETERLARLLLEAQSPVGGKLGGGGALSPQRRRSIKDAMAGGGVSSPERSATVTSPRVSRAFSNPMSLSVSRPSPPQTSRTMSRLPAAAPQPPRHHHLPASSSQQQYQLHQPQPQRMQRDPSNASLQRPQQPRAWGMDNTPPPTSFHYLCDSTSLVLATPTPTPPSPSPSPTPSLLARRERSALLETVKDQAVALARGREELAFERARFWEECALRRSRGVLRRLDGVLRDVAGADGGEDGDHGGGGDDDDDDDDDLDSDE